MSIKLPFRQEQDAADYFPKLNLGFTPYAHQQRAFARLQGDNPQSTIIATGTGSGKTECFMYPILDHCRQNAAQEGIKAILLYPMNALATDQSRRLAELIYNTASLRNCVTVGMYVGGDAQQEGQREMTATSAITDRETMRLSPPDILITNYKMLDFLMIRPQDFKLWQHNVAGILRYLVVDELHSFDGAQGSDLACLIRRLKQRVAVTDELCCIGTSATLGDNDIHSSRAIREYAQEIFGASFDAESVITEDLLNIPEFMDQYGGDNLDDERLLYFPLVDASLDYATYDSDQNYIAAQYQLWLKEPIWDIQQTKWQENLARFLPRHTLTQALLYTLNNQIKSLDEICAGIARRCPELQALSNQKMTWLLQSFLALLSAARVGENYFENGVECQRLRPLVQVRFQLWLRELRRIVAQVAAPPTLHFYDDLTVEDREVSLPPVHCRECGYVGWMALDEVGGEQPLTSNLRKIYRAFFQRNRNILYVFPQEVTSRITPNTSQNLYDCPHICARCLTLSRDTVCSYCGAEGLIPVRTIRRIQGENAVKCPVCNATDSYSIMGSRAASLTSVAISQLFASPYNRDKKLLAFSDSVQDASHRAGFFAARTYRFNLRSALQKVVAKHEGIPLSELASRFNAQWEKSLGRKSFLATFFPVDLYYLHEYQEFLHQDTVTPQLYEILKSRLSWEITAEYGYNARIGRTLEKNRCSTIYIPPEIADVAIAESYETLKNQLGILDDLCLDDFRCFVYGIWMRWLKRGAIYHQGLDHYLQSSGSYYSFGLPLYMPHAGKKTRLPAFVTLAGSQRFENVTAKDSWYRDWLQRSLHLSEKDARYYIADIYQPLLHVWQQKKLMFAKASEHLRVYGFRPDVLRVSSDVVLMQCQKCQHSIAVWGPHCNIWQQTPCLQLGCHARYSRYEHQENFYHNLFCYGDVKRIFCQ